jgi:hypothetical protein
MTNFLFGNVADRLVPVLQTPVEDIIYEVLDQKGFPTRQEVRDLRNKLDRLEKSLENLTSALAALKTEVEQAGTTAADALERATSSSPAPKAKAKAADAPKAAATAATKVCKVGECETGVRARGFCAKHYQKWKRGTLGGYVGPEGTTEHEAVTYFVDTDAAGQTVQTRYEADEVIFMLPEDDGRIIRVKVDDVRRYDE